MKKLVSIALVLAIAVSLVACAGEKPAPEGPGSKGSNSEASGFETMHLTVGGAVNAGSSYTIGLTKMGEILEERSGGAITLEYFPDSLLGSELECAESVGNGIMEMSIGSTANLANFAKEMGIFDLPFLITDRRKAYEVFDGEIGREILDTLLPSNIYVFGLLDQGFRHLTNNKEEITNIDQIQGFKIRVMENKIHQALWTALGAYPTPMAWGEVFTALEQGTIDGQENPLSAFDATKIYEVQKYCTLTGHVYTPGYIIIGYDLLNSFNDETKALFLEAAEEGIKYQREWAIQTDLELMSKLEGYGLTFSELEDKEVWQERAQTIYADFAGDFKQEWIDAFK